MITMLQDILIRMDTFSSELGNLKQDVTDLKASRGSTTPITIEPSVTSSVSELSVRMDTISTQMEKPNDVVRLNPLREEQVNELFQILRGQQGTSSNILQEITKCNQMSEVDRMIIRCHTHGQNVIHFPADTTDESDMLPFHGFEDIVPPHNHSSEKLRQLHTLPPRDAIAMVKSEPAFIDWDGKDICPECNEGIDDEDETTLCHFCKGEYHEPCQIVIEYREKYNICNYCRKLLKVGITCSLMQDCPECSAWVSSKKDQITQLVKHRLISERIRALDIIRDGMLSKNILEIVSTTENAIADAYKAHSEAVAATLMSSGATTGETKAEPNASVGDNTSEANLPNNPVQEQDNSTDTPMEETTTLPHTNSPPFLPSPLTKATMPKHT